MEQVLSRILNSEGPPTRQDIADLLASIGSPGKKRTQKAAAVKRLFDELGHSGLNAQGHHVADDLTSYEAF